MDTVCLKDKMCVACQGLSEALHGEELAALTRLLPEWTVVGEHHIHRQFSFPNFSKAMVFANLIGQVAEEQKHHPKITLSWGKVEVEIFTHAVNGLTENDFILAARIDAL